MFILSFTTTVVLWILAAGQEDPCPSDESIDPCYCYQDYPGHYVVECDKVHDLNLLRKVLDVTRGRKVSLTFENSVLGAIPSDMFEGQLADVIEFNFCEIESFGDKPFSGTEDTLEKIDIFQSLKTNVKDLESLPLSHMKKLHTVMIEENNFKNVGNDWFQSGPTSVTHLSLEENGIEKIGEKAFVSLVNLEEIWLSENPLKTISRSVLPNPANKLETLELSNIGIDTIPEDFFTNMPRLFTVNLGGNNLVTLPQTTWGRVWNSLDTVYVDDNPIVCDSRLSWIYEEMQRLYFHGECSAPKHLLGKLLEEISLEDLNN